jgi:spoIIIJ-associated protein
MTDKKVRAPKAKAEAVVSDATEVVEVETAEVAAKPAAKKPAAKKAKAESTEATETAEGETPAKALEEEGEIAADYLEELLDIFDLDGDIDIDVRQGRAYLEISADQKSNLRLISDPETVEALQELTRLAVQVKTNSFSRLILDVGGSRQARVTELTRIVNKIIDKVKDNGVAVPMKPMSSYERKIVHDIVSEAGLTSESEGEGRERHIVVKAAE